MTATARDFKGNPLPPAEALVWHLDDGTGLDRKLRREIFNTLPNDIALRAAERYQRTYDKTGNNYAANRALVELTEKITRKRRALASSDDDLRDYARRRADECCRLLRVTGDINRGLAALESVGKREGVATPEPGKRGVTIKGAIARMCDERWWRRAIRRTHGREVEGAAIALGMVHKRAEIYSSDGTVNRRREQKRRNLRALQAMQAVNELGQEYTLAELAELSVSNPIIKRGELMTRMAGFEQVAERLEHAAMFYTITCPSRMHARHVATGEENEKYDGTTPRQAHRYLCAVWAKARASIARSGCTMYGFRIAEPHHDGTPHWHLLLFLPRDMGNVVTETLRRYALECDGNERGAAEHRLKAVEIDRNRGTATGYVAKYVAKNIDGFGVEVDLYGKNPKTSAERVDAWASTWGIRQFQQIGGPGVTVWRELRRIREAPQGILEDCRKATDKPADWAKFVELQGGPTAKRKERPIVTVKRPKESKYGEESLAVVGVAERVGGQFAETRTHQWTIRRANATGNNSDSQKIRPQSELPGVAEGQQAKAGSDRYGRSDESLRARNAGQSKAGVGSVATVSGGKGSGRGAVALRVPGNNVLDFFAVAREVCAPWSPVNNCTQPPWRWRLPRLWKFGGRWYAVRKWGELCGRN